MPSKKSTRTTRPGTPDAQKVQGTERKAPALDAACQVLSEEAGEGGMSAAELIDRMRERSLWISPSGKTPSATLYAAMIREIARLGEEARFRRVAPGRFAAAAAVSRGKKRARPAPRTPRPAADAGRTKSDPVASGGAKELMDPAPKPARKRRRTGGKAGAVAARRP